MSYRLLENSRPPVVERDGLFVSNQVAFKWKPVGVGHPGPQDSTGRAAVETQV